MYSRNQFAKLQTGLRPVQSVQRIQYTNTTIIQAILNVNYIFEDNNMSDRSLKYTQNSLVDSTRMELKVRGPKRYGMGKQ